MRRARLLALLPLLACRSAPTPPDPDTAHPSPTPGALADAQSSSEQEPPAEPASELDPSDEDEAEQVEDRALAPLPDRIAAEVGSVNIPMSAFHEIYDLKVVKYTVRGRTIPPSADARYRKSIVQRLIYHEVLQREAARLGVVYDKAKLAERESNQKRGIKDWPLHLQRRGETEKSLREMYVAELLEVALLEQLGKLSVSQAEIEAEYAKVKSDWHSDQPRVRASHILIALAGADGSPTDDVVTSESEAKATAWRVHALAQRRGADFAALAREHSTGPMGGTNGDLGIFTADRMVEAFSNAAFKLKVGQVSKPVRTEFGWHIIKVTDRWPPGELPIDALRDSISERLRQRKHHEGRRALKDELLAKTPIVDHVSATVPPLPVQ